MDPIQGDRDEWEDRSHPILEDMRLQQTTWRVQRIGWLVITLLLGFGLLGLFGGGLLSTVTAVDGSGRIEVVHGRFERNGGATSLRLRVNAAGADEITVTLGARFLGAFAIESMSPQALREVAHPHGADLTFATRGEPMEVVMQLRPREIGLVRYAIGLPDSAPAEIIQFVYP